MLVMLWVNDFSYIALLFKHQLRQGTTVHKAKTGVHFWAEQVQQVGETARKTTFDICRRNAVSTVRNPLGHAQVVFANPKMSLIRSKGPHEWLTGG